MVDDILSILKEIIAYNRKKGIVTNNGNSYLGIVTMILSYIVIIPTDTCVAIIPTIG